MAYTPNAPTRGADGEAQARRWRGGSCRSLAALDLGRIRELLKDRAQLGSFLSHPVDVFLEGAAPLPLRRFAVGRVQPRRGLEGFEPAVVQRSDEFASAVRGVVHLPESFEEGDDRGHAPPEHQRVFAPLDLEGTALVLADRLEPRPGLVERPTDQARIAVDVCQFRIRVCGELEQSVERTAAERVDLRTRVAQEPHEGVRVGAGRGRRHTDSAPLAHIEEERDCEVCAGPRQEVKVRGRRSLVESIDRFVERPCILGRGRRLRDLLEALDLSLQLPDPGFDRPIRLPIASLESSDFRALLGDPVESAPGFPRPIEIATAGFPQRRIEPGNEARRETFLLRRLPEVRGDRLDVPGEDAHLAPVVHLALPEEAIDPLSVAIQCSVEDAGDPLDLLARPPDRFKELGSLRFEGIRRRRVAGRHESDAMEPRAYLGSFGRLSKPPSHRGFIYLRTTIAVAWESSKTSVTSSSPWMTWTRPSPSIAISSGSAWSAKGARFGP